MTTTQDITTQFGLILRLLENQLEDPDSDIRGLVGSFREILGDDAEDFLDSAELDAQVAQVETLVDQITPKIAELLATVFGIDLMSDKDDEPIPYEPTSLDQLQKLFGEAFAASRQ